MSMDTPDKQQLRNEKWEAIQVPAKTDSEVDVFFPRSVDKETMLERLTACKQVYENMLSIATERQQDAVAWFLKVDIAEYSEDSKMMREQALSFSRKVRDSATTIKDLTEQKFWETYQHSREYWDRGTDRATYDRVVDLILGVEQLIHAYDHKVKVVFSGHIAGYDRVNRRRAGFDDEMVLCDQCNAVV